MSTYDKRLDAVEKDIAVMKQDIIYKLDDTNSAVGIIRGLVWAMSQDVRVVTSQIKTMDIRLEGIDTRLARLQEQQVEQRQDITDIKRYQEKQGQDTEEMKGRLDSVGQNFDQIDRRFEGIDKRLDGMDQKFDKMLQLLTGIATKLRTE